MGLQRRSANRSEGTYLPTICRSLPKRDDEYLAIFGYNDEIARLLFPMNSVLMDRAGCEDGWTWRKGEERKARVVYTDLKEGIGLPTQVLVVNQKLESHS